MLNLCALWLVLVHEVCLKRGGREAYSFLVSSQNKVFSLNPRSPYTACHWWLEPERSCQGLGEEAGEMEKNSHI